MGGDNKDNNNFQSDGNFSIGSYEQGNNMGKSNVRKEKKEPSYNNKSNG